MLSSLRPLVLRNHLLLTPSVLRHSVVVNFSLTMDKPAKHVSSEVIAKGKWIQLENVAYEDESGKQRSWEMASRTTRPANTTVDCVGVLTVLKRKGKENCIVFVRQYRPPLRAYTIEFPAGLIDEGESADVTALRELKEETGYSGRVKHVGPEVALDPGVSNCIMRLVDVEVDGDTAENKECQKVVQEGERTEVKLVELSKLQEQLEEWSNAGDVLDSRVGAFANALRFKEWICE